MIEKLTVGVDDERASYLLANWLPFGVVVAVWLDAAVACFDWLVTKKLRNDDNIYHFFHHDYINTFVFDCNTGIFTIFESYFFSKVIKTHQKKKNLNTGPGGDRMGPGKGTPMSIHFRGRQLSISNTIFCITKSQKNFKNLKISKNF